MVDQWTEIAFVAISDEDGNEAQFGTIIDTIDLAWGSRDIESIATVSSGRVTKFIPEDLSEITLELFPVGISSPDLSTSPKGIHAWFLGLSPDSTHGLVTFTRKKFRVTVLWCDSTSVTDATAATPATKAAFRVSFWNCYLTDATLDFTDDLLKSTVTFKAPPYTRAGLSGKNILAEETDGTTALVALAAYSGQAAVDPN